MVGKFTLVSQIKNNLFPSSLGLGIFIRFRVNRHPISKLCCPFPMLSAWDAEECASHHSLRQPSGLQTGLHCCFTSPLQVFDFQRDFIYNTSSLRIQDPFHLHLKTIKLILLSLLFWKESTNVQTEEIYYFPAEHEKPLCTQVKRIHFDPSSCRASVESPHCNAVLAAVWLYQ